MSTTALYESADVPIELKTDSKPNETISTSVKRKVEQLQRILPTVLVNPCRPAVKRIKTEYNRRVSAIRCSIPDAYHKIKNLNYEIRKLTAPAEISRVRSELNKNHAIILRAQCQMRTAHQEKKT